jgi:hypothetical protein
MEWWRKMASGGKIPEGSVQLKSGGNDRPAYIA